MGQISPSQHVSGGPDLLPKNKKKRVPGQSTFTTHISSNNTAGNLKNYGGTVPPELKLHWKCYSGMVQILVQAVVTPQPHTETFLKLDLEYKNVLVKKKLWRI